MKIRLLVGVSQQSSYHFESEGPKITMGRAPNCDVAISVDANQSVSWTHAIIELTRQKAWLTDLGSTNGTFLNDRRVEGRVTIKTGDHIRLGQTGPALQIVELELIASAFGKPIANTKFKASAVRSVTNTSKASTTEAETGALVSAVRQSQRKMLTCLAGIVVLVISLAGLFWWQMVNWEANRNLAIVKKDDIPAALIPVAPKPVVQQSDLDAFVERYVRSAELTAAEKETHKRQLESINSLQRAMDERLRRILDEPSDRSLSSIAVGTTVTDALGKIEKIFDITILLDEAGFEEFKVKNLGKVRLRELLSTKKKPPIETLTEFFDKLEPIEGFPANVKSDNGLQDAAGFASTDLVMQFAFVSEMIPLPSSGTPHFPIPLFIIQDHQRVWITPERPALREPPVDEMARLRARLVPAPADRLEAADWKRPQEAVIRYKDNYGQAMHPKRATLLKVVPTSVTFRLPNSNQINALEYKRFNWIRTRDNFFMYNELQKELEPVFTHYKFIGGREPMFRQATREEVHLGKWITRADAVVELQLGAKFYALVSLDIALEIVISFPFDSPPQIPADRVKAVYTSGQTLIYDNGRFSTRIPTAGERRTLLEYLESGVRILELGHRGAHALRGILNIPQRE